MVAAAIVGTAALAGACECGDSGLHQARPAAAVATRVLDFGPVREGATEVRAVEVRSVGQSRLDVEAELSGETSSAFTVVDGRLGLEAGRIGEVTVRFAPQRAGSEAGVLVLHTNDPERERIEVELAGGPIAPALHVDPDPVDFLPTYDEVATRSVTLTNAGLATLVLDEIVLDPVRSPDFELMPPALPLALPPGDALALSVTYHRSGSDAAGRLVVVSDDPDAPTRHVALLPDPCDPDDVEGWPDGCRCPSGSEVPCYDGPEGTEGVGLCQAGIRTCVAEIWGPCVGQVLPAAEVCSGLDEDCDGTPDNPPGGCDCIDGTEVSCYSGPEGTAGEGICQAGLRTCVDGRWSDCEGEVLPRPETCNGLDDDCDGETDNRPEGCECEPDETRPCYSGPPGTEDVGICQGGTQTCVDFVWGPCEGEVLPRAEACNGLDDDCDGEEDSGGVCDPVVCEPDGTWVLDGPAIRYDCCFQVVDIDINRFEVMDTGERVQAFPKLVRYDTGATLTLLGDETWCPGGELDNALTIPGDCDETYRIEGEFMDEDTFEGTFRATFVGPLCNCYDLDPCANQIVPFTATRQ